METEKGRENNKEGLRVEKSAADKLADPGETVDDDVAELRSCERKYRRVRENGDDNDEKPMDLTFSQRFPKGEVEASTSSQNTGVGSKLTETDCRVYDEAKANATVTISKLAQANLIANSVIPKKRGRKRKDDIEVQINSANITTPYDNPDYVQTMDSRQTEVLMAAKSLFSKRTRTLYHWMYPNTPKAQLKSAVSMSWETLGMQEKEFYISQVLGRFGFPQSSLMVNPQLGGLRGVPILPPLDLSAPPHLNMETHNAVSTILENQDSGPWSQFNYPPPHTKRVNRKKGRLGRPPGSKSHKMQQSARPVAVENISDDFQDDPELRREFEQFKWTLHMTDK